MSQLERHVTSSSERKMLKDDAVKTRSRHPVISWLFLLTLSAGCNRIQKTGECRRFAAMINHDLAEIEALVSPRSAAGYRAGSRGYTKLVAALRADKTRSGELLSEEFAQAFEAAARASLALADGIDAKDQRRQDEARRELERLSRHEQGMVLRTNAHCENP